MRVGNVEVLFGGFGSNTYVIHDKKVCVVDPGLTEDFGIDVSKVGIVIDTHAHYDHTAHNSRFPKARVLAHPPDLDDILTGKNTYADHFGAEPRPVKVEPIPDEIDFGKTSWRVLHTPGHTRGSISLYEPGERILICGDLLFADGIGRTDLHGGDLRQLRESVKKVSQLKVEYVLPGHGPIGNKASIEKALAVL